MPFVRQAERAIPHQTALLKLAENLRIPGADLIKEAVQAVLAVLFFDQRQEFV